MDAVSIDADESTIFVSVPSYRDPECASTITDLIAKAKNPERIIFGVCEQNEPGDQSAVPAKYQSAVGIGNRIRLTKMNASEAKGPAYARSVIEQELYDPSEGLEVFMQIDSHTRVVRNWDALCLQDILACEAQRNGDFKFIITMYPDNYDLYGSSTKPAATKPAPTKLPNQTPTPTAVTLGRTVQEIDTFSSASFLDVANFSAFHSWHPVTKMPMHYQYKFRNISGPAIAPSVYHPTGFFSANFAIGRVDAWHEVPYDAFVPYLFLGEEQSMAARMYTHGWDMMLPKYMFVYSKSERDYRPVYWEQFKTKYNRTPDRVCTERTLLYDQSMARIQSLLWHGTIDNGGPDDQMFGLGYERSLAQYEAHVGFTFRTQTASVRSRLGVTGGASEIEWIDKHGVQSSDWKRIYELSLKRNFMPLSGPAPANIKTLSARDFLKKQQQQTNSRPTFGSAAFDKFQQRQQTPASQQQQPQKQVPVKPYTPPPPKLANGLARFQVTKQTTAAAAAPATKQRQSTQKSAYQQWTSTQQQPQTTKQSAVAAYTAAMKQQQQRPLRKF